MRISENLFNMKTCSLLSKKNIIVFPAILMIPALIFFIFSKCKSDRTPDTRSTDSMYLVTARAETKPVASGINDDAADDPAIWINYLQPDSSRIIGTDKTGGLNVYDLSGKEVFHYKTGKMNNADLRYGFQLDSLSIDILAVSNRTDQSIDLYKVNSDGALSVIHKERLLSKMTEEVYGLCMYHSRLNGKFYVFVNDKNGNIEQWELFADGIEISGKIVRTLKLKTQVEGMVADDETGFLYAGEEDTGIWKFEADPLSEGVGLLLPMSSEKENPNILFDIEGLAIYSLPDSDGYLIASSQGNDSYAVFERQSPNKYLGSFKIVKGAVYDGSEGTDGLDITSFPLGSGFPSGLLVVQDGDNDDNGIAMPQNFKLVRWDSVAIKFTPPLK
jgi:3-phytase